MMKSGCGSINKLFLVFFTILDITLSSQESSVGILRAYLDRVNSKNESTLVIDTGNEKPECEAINVPMCINTNNYKLTRMPNNAGHESQEEASLFIHQFAPLVKVKCYEFLTQFVCSVFLPMCVIGHNAPIPPCRKFCEEARQGCEPIMNQVGIGWPENMWCERFPEFDPETTVCLMPSQPRMGEMTTLATPKPTKKPKLPKISSKTSNICSSRERRASIVYGHTFFSKSEIIRKKGKSNPEKLDGLKKPVTVSSKDKYVIKTLNGRTDYSDSKIVKLVSLCVRTKGARKITVTFEANGRVVARNVMRVKSGSLGNWSNSCLCDNFALYVDKITIQLKSLSGLENGPKRMGKIRNVEALVCERNQHFMDTLH